MSRKKNKGKSKAKDKISNNTYKIRGHTSHRGGAGYHGDCRTKRQKTRADQNRKALEE